MRRVMSALAPDGAGLRGRFGGRRFRRHPLHLLTRKGLCPRKPKRGCATKFYERPSPHSSSAGSVMVGDGYVNLLGSPCASKYLMKCDS